MEIKLIHPPTPSPLNGFHPNLKAYGVKGDGVTDDSSALQKIIDDNKGNVIVFPSAKGYVISTTLEIPDNTTVVFPRENGKLLIPENHHLKGYEDFFETQDGGVLEAVITNKNQVDGKNVHIYGAHVDGQRNLALDQAVAGILLKNCSHSSVKRCLVERLPFGIEATLVNRRRFYGILLFAAIECHVDGNEVHPVRYENIGIRYGSKRNKITNNICIQSTEEVCGHNIQASSGWDNIFDYLAEENLIHGNVCLNSNHAGIITHDAPRNIVSNNIIKYPSAYGLKAIGVGAFENVYSDNYVYKPDGTEDGDGIGIGLLGGAKFNTFNNNTVFEPAYLGVELAANYNNIDGVMIIRPAQAGFYIIGGSQNNVNGVTVIESGTNGVQLANASDNVLSNIITNGSVQHGIFLASGADKNTITNAISGFNTKSGISLSGVSNNSITSCTARRNKEYGIILNGSSSNQITNNYCHSNGQKTDNTFDNIVLDGSSNYNNVQNNTCRQGEETNKPRNGIFSTINTTGNFITNNDLYDAGKTSNLKALGTGTITTAGNRI
ncbi:right-handed parallel beta-helix repeat-containing protein [Halobacillus sp. KGW1]|uniref:right-handed parallel beta-helix repeat-containing protein n=1 Tax=Halobacillus sp. KGW1 TaxID=1793726 RepID=UPI000782B073|nr:right-handed parallel beta-helix repeat-containing protein [Halobacillus sp. KGW1]